MKMTDMYIIKLIYMKVFELRRSIKMVDNNNI